jgi:hypothetical protein
MHRLSTLTFLVMAAACPAALAQYEYDQPPISYSATEPRDPAARVQQLLATGRLKLKFEQTGGYLSSLLEHLGIPRSSQTLVFSKTSLQRQVISPRNPRALYYNDDVYVGFIPGGEFIEIAAMDPAQGAMFYTLEQKEQATSKLLRQTHNCLQCHDSSSQTGGVPGLIVRSVYPDASGQPLFAAGTHKTTDASPWAERWGGWYATGTHGPKLLHMGNVTFREGATQGADLSQGGNITDLSKKVDLGSYLSPHSDLVALLVLEHQAEAHNLLTRANYSARLAIRAEEEINQALGRPAGQVSPDNARVRSAGEALLKYMLFSEEAKLAGPMKGTSDFAEAFSAAGPRDSKGRSLRDLDLQTRLLKHPCSHLIYSRQFDALPGPMKDYVYRRLREVLTGKDQSKPFAHLSADDRAAIRQILRDTKKDLPSDW